jgi:hypothetical protein
MSYTITDQNSALQYAKDRITKELCNSPDFLKKICKNNNSDNCLIWKKDNSNKIWSDICNYNTDQICKVDTDCPIEDIKTKNVKCIPNPDNTSDTNKYCGFCTKDQDSGHCAFNNPQICKQFSGVPYICDSSGKNCTTNKKNQVTPKPYLEWNTSGDSSKCIYGNFVSRLWAEDPASRPNLSEKEMENLPPPFIYDTSNSNMYITDNYCKRYNLNYGSGECSSNADCKGVNGNELGTCHESVDSTYKVCSNTVCSTNEDCKSGDICYKKNPTDSKGFCNGKSSNCWTTVGQDVGEMLLGKTIFNGFSRLASGKNPFSCASDVGKFLNDTLNNFKKLPKNISSLADNKYFKTKTLIAENFAGKNINLYIIEWKPESNMKKIKSTGFDAEEVKTLYPELIKSIDGKNYIEINIEHAKKNKDMKRIYLTLNSTEWILQNVLHEINMVKASK